MSIYVYIYVYLICLHVYIGLCYVCACVFTCVFSYVCVGIYEKYVLSCHVDGV